MKSEITSNHFNDADGNPSGGITFGRGFAIGWQNGPLGRGEDRIEPNGAFVEDVLASALDRLNYYQESRFNCEHNAIAVRHIESALAALNDRTVSREERGVEGTHEE